MQVLERAFRFLLVHDDEVWSADEENHLNLAADICGRAGSKSFMAQSVQSLYELHQIAPEIRFSGIVSFMGKSDPPGGVNDRQRRHTG